MMIFQMLPVFAMVGASLFLARKFAIASSVALQIAVALTLVALFFGALAGALFITALLLLVLGGGLLIQEILLRSRSKQAVPLPVLVFLFFSTLFWIAHPDGTYYFYDAYSHWGIFLKEAIATGRVWGTDTNSIHPKYLPGPTLWQYLFAVFSPRIEAAAFHGQFVLLITPLMVLFDGIRRHRLLWVSLITALVIILLFNFGHGIQSVYIDHVLGTWIAGTLIGFLLLRKNDDPRAGWALVLPVAVIALMKSTGIFFVVVVSGSMLVTALVSRMADRNCKPGQSLAAAIVAVLAAALMLAAWQADRNNENIVSDGTSADGIVSRLLSVESMFSDDDQALIKKRFVHVVLNQQLSKGQVSEQFHAFSTASMPAYTDRVRLTTATFLFLSLVLIATVYRFADGKCRLEWCSVSLLLWLATLCYLAMLYFGYVYVSGSDNGLILSSYIRYLHSLILPLSLVVFAALLPVLSGKDPVSVNMRSFTPAEARRLGFLSIAVAALLVFETPYLKSLYSTREAPGLRWSIAPAVDGVRERIGDASVVVVVDVPDPNGFIRHMIRYQLTPGKAEVVLLENSLLEDPQTYLSDLEGFEYIWFASANDRLDAVIDSIARTGSDMRVYKIEPAGSRIVLDGVQRQVSGQASR